MWHGKEKRKPIIFFDLHFEWFESKLVIYSQWSFKNHLDILTLYSWHDWKFIPCINLFTRSTVLPIGLSSFSSTFWHKLLKFNFFLWYTLIFQPWPFIWNLLKKSYKTSLLCLWRCDFLHYCQWEIFPWIVDTWHPLLW